MKRVVFFVALALCTNAFADLEDKKTVSGIYVGSNGSISIGVNNAELSKTCVYSAVILRDSTTTVDTITIQAWYSGLLAAERAGQPVSVTFTRNGLACYATNVTFY